MCIFRKGHLLLKLRKIIINSEFCIYIVSFSVLSAFHLYQFATDLCGPLVSLCVRFEIWQQLWAGGRPDL